MAFASRLPFLGNPVIEGDEQFYLLVGDHFLRGTLPYVGIWDRKPVGLFLVYAGIRALGGEGILQYQIVAALFAAATAFLVARIARAVAGPRGALLAGVAYLLWLTVFGGEGGQSPVFYNLPMAGAALLTLRAVTGPLPDPGAPARLTGLGAAAMLAVGVAVQIKYTAVFEGLFLGCALLWRGWRLGLGARRSLGRAALWIGCALLPTLAAVAAYAALGALQAFLFANFTSIFRRNTAAAGSSLGRLATMAGLLLPLAAAAALGLRAARREAEAGAGRPGIAFVAGWTAAAVAGVLLFGTYYNHYALPLLVPLSVAAAPLLDRPGARLFRLPAAPALLLAALAMGGLSAAIHLRSRGDGSQVRALAEAVPPGASLYVFDGETVIYLLARSALPTPYVFPTHLNDRREVGGIGVDPVAELRRVLDSRPDFIVATDGPRDRINPEAWSLVSEALRAGYRPIRTVRVGNRARILYGRRT